MITKKTVLVLGAGASHFYGFPLGAKLRKDILEILRPGTSSYQLSIESRLVDHPLLHEFVDTFQKSRLSSIDAFLGLNLRYSDIGKMSIAALLMHYEALAVGPLLHGLEQNWYDYLWNKLASSHSWDELSFKNLAVVTFNYDRSLETFLLAAVKASYGVKENAAIQKLSELKIIHTYGDIGSPWPNDARFKQYGAGVSPALVVQCSKWLKVIPEARANEPTFTEAKKLLLGAEAICFLGFGFDALNLERLDSLMTCATQIERPNKAPRRRTVAASCLGRTPREAVSDADKCGVSTEYLPKDRPVNFVDGDCLATLRETLILD